VLRPSRAFQGRLAVFLLGNALNAFAEDCRAIYSVVEKHGKLLVPGVELDEGTILKADLDQVRGVAPFVFKLNTASIINPPAGIYARLVISQTDHLTDRMNAVSCLAKIFEVDILLFDVFY
jgi:hypothetical protein